MPHMRHHAAYDQLLHAEIAETVVELCAEEAVGAVFVYYYIIGVGLDTVGYLAAVGALVEKRLVIGVDVPDIYNGAADSAAIADKLYYAVLSLTRSVELTGSALKVVVLYVNDDQSFFHIHISLYAVWPKTGAAVLGFVFY